MNLRKPPERLVKRLVRRYYSEHHPRLFTRQRRSQRKRGNDATKSYIALDVTAAALSRHCQDSIIHSVIVNIDHVSVGTHGIYEGGR